jgi:inner membrane protein
VAQTFLQSLSRIVRSPAFKLVLVGILALLLGIPLLFVWALVDDRERRSHDVSSEIARSWGGQQDIMGPFLIVPFTTRVVTTVNEKQIESTEERFAVFMPDKLDVAAETTSQVLYRSIYKVPVYNGELTFSGHFDRPDMSLVGIDVLSVHWDGTVLALGLSDVSGLKHASPMSVIGSSSLTFEPSIGVPGSPMSGIHARLRPNDESKNSTAGPEGLAREAFDFSFALSLSGSFSMNFAPVARETAVTLASDWPNPSFTGAFLPFERKIDKSGFTAMWKVPHLARSVPQAWSLPESELSLSRLSNYEFGADLFVPVDFYDLVTRALKYGLMFPVVTFMAVFIMEVLTRQPLHPVQYLFAGAALVLFFVLLLSFAEHVGFVWAYVIAAAATSLLVSVYIAQSVGSLMKGLAVLAMLLILYGLLYLILRLEDYALLAGALTGFAALAAAMFLTLGVNWSGEVPAEHKSN